MATKNQAACLSKEFKKLKRKKTMAQKQKVAIALNVCKVPKKGIGSTEDNQKIEKLTNQKNEMLKQFKELSKLKKKLYSKVDITSPMSAAEKELTKKMSSISSEMFQVIREIQKITNK